MVTQFSEQTILQTLQQQKDFFKTGITLTIANRKQILLKLLNYIKQYEEELLQALYADMRKSSFEAYATEIGIVYQEIKFHVKNLQKWSRGQLVKTNQLIHFWSTSRVVPQPYGQTLIISPWNYPFQLTLMPLIGAISAGNTAVIKPSEFTPKTATVITKIIQDVFSPGWVSVFTGGPEVSQQLLDQKWDYIFFTGSPRIGRLVMQAAAKYLTPVTLELGGKSPTIVTQHANIAVAAKRIVWGKLINAGQTCIAPDYVLVNESIKDVFVKYLIHYIKAFYGENIETNNDFPAMVNQHHAQRVVNYLQQGKVLYGGSYNLNNRFIEPTILEVNQTTQPVMEEEIFGPVLPVLTFKNLADAADFINQKPKPLALYIFTEVKHEVEYIMQHTISGSMCINEVIMQVANEHLPFGGVGNSGMGSYHGYNSFLAFSHKRSVLKKATWIDIPLRYPPFGNKLKWVKRFLS
jgi:aldehyde dehydrogenase (NAD+)